MFYFLLLEFLYYGEAFLGFAFFYMRQIFFAARTRLIIT